jgi:ribosomal protein S18 acetylase RimI-like enzyme
LSGIAKIRPLRLSDREPLSTMVAATGMFTEEEVRIALELIDTVLQVPGQSDYIINVYERDGSVIGYYCLGPTPGTAGTYDLYWIVVSADVHGKGIGTELNEHAENLIRSRQGRLIVAETSSQKKYDPTRGFYDRRGYQQLARIRDYYRPGDDLVVYGKYLSQ